MTRALALALLLAACETTPAVVTRVEYTLPTPPSADLLTLPPDVITAGSGNAKEAMARQAAGIKARDDLLRGWLSWWRAAEQSAAHPAPPTTR